MAERGTIALANVEPCEPVIDLRLSGCRHEKTPVLHDITVQVFQGEILVVTGPSGAGKSTLLGMIHGDFPVSSGEAYAAGQALHRRRRLDLARLRRNVGMVYQDYRLISVLTATENIVFAVRANDPRVGGSTARRRALEALSSVGLDGRGDSFPGRLSGGEQQRVAIARALAVGPRVLVADEPTGNLDRENAVEIISLLVGAARRGTAVVIATHDPGLLRGVASRTVQLVGGRISPPAALAVFS